MPKSPSEKWAVEGWRGILRVGKERSQPRCRSIGARSRRIRRGKDPPDRPAALLGRALGSITVSVRIRGGPPREGKGVRIRRLDCNSGPSGSGSSPHLPTNCRGSPTGRRRHAQNVDSAGSTPAPGTIFHSLIQPEQVMPHMVADEVLRCSVMLFLRI